MPRVIRILVLLVMSLAIPVQGIAATIIMNLCAPSHAAGSVGPTLIQADAHSSHSHPESSGADGTKHLQGHAKAFDSSGIQFGTGSDHADHSGHGMLKCCSMAFSIAAFVGPTLSARIQVRSPAPVRPEALPYQGVILDGLDRPPKLTLA